MTRTVRAGFVDALDDEAERVAFDKRVWSFAVAVFTTFAPVVGTPLSLGMDAVADVVRPDPAWALDYARHLSGPARLGHGQARDAARRVAVGAP